MNMSSIEWTDVTWNPTTGCSKVSQGCKNCYAERLFPKVYPGRAFTDVRVHPDRLDTPLHWKKPRMVFVNSMSDLFHEAVPFEFIDRVFTVMGLSRRHTYQILTKRPERMREYMSRLAKSIAPLESYAREIGWTFKFDGLDGREHSTLPWPLPNVWLGVSVEDQSTADERIPLLLQTPAAVRFISYEPALGPVDLVTGRTYLPNGWCSQCGHPFTARACGPTHAVLKVEPKLDWVICGGESGPKARPMNPDWARSARDQCVAAGVAFFFKQWGEWKGVQRGDPDFVTSSGTFRRDADVWPWRQSGDGAWSVRVGKHAAGRLLDGREFSEYPTPKKGTP